jgi:hypothetical protein
MAFTDLRTTDAVATSKGSPYAIFAVVDTVEPYALVSPVTWYKFPIIMDSNRAGESADETAEYESGGTKKLTSEKTNTLTVTVGQQDLDTKKFIEFGDTEQTLAFIKEEHVVPIKNAAGVSQYQYAVYPAIKRSPSFTRNAKSVETEIVFDISATGNLATLTNIPNSATSGFKATLPATIGVNGVAQAYDLVGVTA